MVVLGAVPGLTGCFRHTRTVQMTHPPAVVLDATADQLVQQMGARFDAIQSMTASVEIEATTGGGRDGAVKEYTSVPGHILLRKPHDLRVLLTVPYVGTQLLDMVSDGDNFKMFIRQPRNKAIVGSNTVTTPSKNALENLRPSIFYDSMLVHSVGKDAFIGMTSDDRVYQPDPKKKDLIEEPDYDLHTYFLQEGTHKLKPLRVIHFGRATLLPYEQDIYDPDTGQLVTEAFYDKYQKFGDILFPSVVTIKRPLDELSLKVTITNLIVNQPMDDDQFQLTIPANVPTQKLP